MSQSPENPNVNQNELNEKTRIVLSKINQLGVDYLSYVAEDSFDSTVMTLALHAPDGRRIIIEKVTPEAKKNRNPAAFLQDTNIRIHAGAMGDRAEFKQEDFNFNQKGDGLIRHRTLAQEIASAEDVPSITSYDTEADIVKRAFVTLHNAKQSVANLGLEEEMGVNNQPATAAQLDSISNLIDASIVLDSRNDYKPVTTQE